MATGFIIILLGAVLSRLVDVWRRNGATTIQHECVAFTTHVAVSTAIWFSLIFLIAISQ